MLFWVLLVVFWVGWLVGGYVVGRRHRAMTHKLMALLYAHEMVAAHPMQTEEWRQWSRGYLTYDEINAGVDAFLKSRGMRGES